MSGLFDEFPPVTTAEWEAQIARDLKDSDLSTLFSTTGEGIRIHPFYRSEDLAGIESRAAYTSTAWKIGCEVTDAESARYAISRGAAALYLKNDADLKDVPLDGIEILRRGSPLMFSVPDSCPAAWQLALALRDELEAGVLELSIGPDYFVEIAKLRTARLLFPNARIVARTSKRNLTIYDPHVNLLRGATEAMSAIIGGCHVLIVRPFDAAYANPGDFSRRLSINTQLLLRDESHFDQMPDPAEGCWYVEWLTDQLLKKAREFAAGSEEPPRCVPQKVFVGVNRYADPNEKARERLTIEPDPDRDAWVFEEPRLETEQQ